MNDNDTDDLELSLKQATELGESIAAQSRIVQELKDRDASTAQEFLEVLLKCRDDLRRPKARLYAPKKARKDAAEG
jgi:hypothetical protein